MTPPGAVGAADRLARCSACGAKLKVPAGCVAISCSSCGLALIATPAFEALPAMVVPRVDRDQAWRALHERLRLPDGEGLTEIRRAVLLLVPYWRHVDEAGRSVARRGVVVSGADLLPIGLPSLTGSAQRIPGLGVEPRTRTGDMMGRLESGQSSIDAVVVDATLAPAGAGPDRADWRLVYYPVWSFHYVVVSKEHFHVVDATSGEPVGPAREPRWPVVSGAAAVAMLALFAAGLPWLGAWGAIPAWAGALIAARAAVVLQRSQGGA